MATSVYRINKGINKPIEFKGLKAQYIGYLACGLVVLLMLFAAMYIVGINMFFCLTVIGALGTLLFMTVFRLSAKYGQHGLMKEMSRRNVPSALVCKTRKVFLNLKRTT